MDAAAFGVRNGLQCQFTDFQSANATFPCPEADQTRRLDRDLEEVHGRMARSTLRTNNTSLKFSFMVVRSWISKRLRVPTSAATNDGGDLPISGKSSDLLISDHEI